MKKSKVLSTEEHKRAEEERARPFRLEITDLPQDCVSIKSPIILTRHKFELLNKICDVTGEHLEDYVKDALFMKVQTDLDNPSCFGQMVCENLRKQWDPIKPQ